MERYDSKVTAFQKELRAVLARHVGPGKSYATKSDVAKAAGVSKSNLTRYITPGQSRQPRGEILSKLSSSLGYPEDYLYNLWAYCHGITDTHPGHRHETKKVADDPPHYHAGRIPTGADTRDFYVRARGKNMTGALSNKQTILEGDLLLIQPNRRPGNGDIIFYRDEKGNGFVKSFQKARDGRIRLGSLSDSRRAVVLEKNKQVNCLLITEIKRKLTHP